jgi:hypothetical protein
MIVQFWALLHIIAYLVQYSLSLVTLFCSKYYDKYPKNCSEQIKQMFEANCCKINALKWAREKIKHRSFASVNWTTGNVWANRRFQQRELKIVSTCMYFTIYNVRLSTVVTALPPAPTIHGGFKIQFYTITSSPVNYRSLYIHHRSV